MNHLPYIAAAYGIAGIVVLWLTADAALRTSRARKKLAAIDPRAGRDE